MMTRRHTRRNLPRIAYKNSYKRIAMAYNSVYRLRKPVICITLLRILPEKTITNNRTRIHLTANRNSTIQPNKSTHTKYSNPICFRGNCIYIYMGRDSSVGIATRYGLDGPGIESRWRRDFPHPSGPALGPTQPPIQCVPGLYRG